MKNKKILVLALAVALIMSAMTVGYTLAYLSDSDSSTINFQIDQDWLTENETTVANAPNKAPAATQATTEATTVVATTQAETTVVTTAVVTTQTTTATIQQVTDVTINEDEDTSFIIENEDNVSTSVELTEEVQAND